jgi:hypothetical protein
VVESITGFAHPQDYFTMQYTYLGRTGVKVSRLCLGTIQMS